MLLIWRAPGASQGPTAGATAATSLELDTFKQNDPSSGYVTVKYRLTGGPGKLRMKIYDSQNPASADWFTTAELKVQPGPGTQLLEFAVKPEAASPTDLIKVDTLEIELLDATGKVLTTLKKQSAMSWVKPKAQ